MSNRYLRHYGVKGMKWGQRKKVDGSNRDKTQTLKTGEVKASSKSNEENLAAEYQRLDIPKKLSNKEKAESLQKNREKFIAKLDGPSKEGKGVSGDVNPKGFRLNKKQAIAIGVGVGVVAIFAVAAYRHKGSLPNPGDLLDTLKYTELVERSKMETWPGSNFLTKSSYKQAEFTLPIGHTFHRLSRVAETDFGQGTYATSNLNDFHRYVVGFAGEIGSAENLQHITWKAKSEIKVPSLVTRLETAREMLSETYGQPISKREALAWYKNNCGGKWDDEMSKNFFDLLSKKGFGAIVDDMDAGVIGESPLVVFAKEQMTSKVAQAMTLDAVKEAENSLKEISNRDNQSSAIMLKTGVVLGATIAGLGVSANTTKGEEVAKEILEENKTEKL